MSCTLRWERAGAVVRGRDLTDEAMRGANQAMRFVGNVREEDTASTLGRWFRKFCGTGCASLCSVVPDATGATRI